MAIQLYNTKDHAIIIKRGNAVAQMVAANEVPEMVVADGTFGALQTQRWAREGCVNLTIEERRKILFKKLELLGLKSWTEQNKERAYWPNTMTSLHWKMEKWGALRPPNTRSK